MMGAPILQPGQSRFGKRADLQIVSERIGLPVVTHAIVGGEVVYATGGVR